jgi:membrane protease YdiL (CAAX protease family)
MRSNRAMTPTPTSLTATETESPTRAPGDGLVSFYVLSCGATWLFALPAALAWSRHATPSPIAVACAGLSAFGPTLAAYVIARRRGALRETFGRWRSNPGWVLGALAMAPVIHFAATAAYVAIGGHPAAWFHPPAQPERWAALVVFPLGEEFGWRGFAHARSVERYGLVRGSLWVGLVWGLWHLAYAVTPEAGGFDVVTAVMTIVELPLYAVLIGWLFEKSGRSMAVAIAAHAGAHLDHLEPATRGDLRWAAVHLVVVGAIAVVVGAVTSRSWVATRS